MKPKHINIRIEQCLALAKASGCPRRKLGALLVDPDRNVILADGYNGGPRGAEGSLCRGHWCERNGFPAEDVHIQAYMSTYTNGKSAARVELKKGGPDLLDVCPKSDPDFLTRPGETPTEKAELWVAEMAEKFPPIKSGTMMERGCHHAEMNVVCNAAANGIACKGAWMIVLAEPCMMCAKLIHHAGITKVIVVDGGYMGGKDGVDYLRDNGVAVQEVEGPQDPRFKESP